MQIRRNIFHLLYARHSFIVLVLFCATVVCCIGSRTILAEEEDGAKRPRTPEDYLALIKDTFKKQNYMKPALEKKLIEQAEKIIRDNFDKKGAENAGEHKYQVFRDLFPGYITASKTVHIEEDPNLFAEEKAIFFPQQLEFGLVLFFSRRPYSRAQRKELRGLLKKLKDKYADTIGERFPEYKRIAGEEELQRMVGDCVDKYVAAKFEDYFGFSGIIISIEKIKRHIEKGPPHVKPKFPNQGKEWLDKLKDPSLTIHQRENTEETYIWVTKDEIMETLRLWTGEGFYGQKQPDSIRMYAKNESEFEKKVKEKVKKLKWFIDLSFKDIFELSLVKTDARNTFLSQMNAKRKKRMNAQGAGGR